MLPFRIPAAVAALSLLAATACEDPTAVRETRPPTLVAYELYALTGAPLIYPSAVNLLSRSAVRVELTGGSALPFDLAFDLADDGQVVIYPARVLIAAPELVAARRVGLQAWIPENTSFEDARRAPDRGYQADSAVVVAVGRPVAYELPLPQGTYSFYDQQCVANPVYRGKLVVDSVNASTRAMYVRIVSNENCGGRNVAAASDTSST